MPSSASPDNTETRMAAVVGAAATSAMWSRQSVSGLPLTSPNSRAVSSCRTAQSVRFARTHLTRQSSSYCKRTACTAGRMMSAIMDFASREAHQLVRAPVPQGRLGPAGVGDECRKGTKLAIQCSQLIGESRHGCDLTLRRDSDTHRLRESVEGRGAPEDWARTHDADLARKASRF